jgi:cytochrome c-type biogenesis protein CcmE
MNAGMKFTLGAVLIVGSVGYLMASGVKQTGQYFLTPSELSQKLAADPTFYASAPGSSPAASVATCRTRRSASR